MKIPFTKQAFLDVFEQYNLAVWPAQLVLLAISMACLFVIVRRTELSGRMAFLVLSMLWLWMGVMYHLVYFSTINPAAVWFGAFFIVQAILFFYFGVLQPLTSPAASSGWRTQAALAIVGYAVVVYPLLGILAGHSYPNGPTFGVPCPTTIFTFGVLMLLPVRVPWWMAAIPLLWALVGFSAAVSLSMPEDFGLTAAGFLYVLSRRVSAHPAQLT